MSVGRQRSFWKHFGQISGPVLIIGGGRDQKYMNIARRLADLNSNLTVDIIAEAGHNVHFEQTKKYIRIVAGFLDRYDNSQS
jgi:2-succinyl-6-hydroxy-2,4-cyclohexadiene-1-carboxylate synthase